jgi:hypothetical protein
MPHAFNNIALASLGSMAHNTCTCACNGAMCNSAVFLYVPDSSMYLQTLQAPHAHVRGNVSKLCVVCNEHASTCMHAFRRRVLQSLRACMLGS